MKTSIANRAAARTLAEMFSTSDYSMMINVLDDLDTALERVRILEEAIEAHSYSCKLYVALTKSRAVGEEK